MIKARICLLCALFVSAVSLAGVPEERIEVTARLPHYQSALKHILPAQRVTDETTFSSDSVATLLSQSPEINLNGQGGLFQAINLRGFARWRIQTRVEGIPIHTERRAGTAAEFVPPGFISQAYVTPGAASTQLGSGAIGGGVDLMLSAPQRSALTYRYGHLADYRDIQAAGVTRSNTTSWILSHRHANNSRDANGSTITDGFEQHSVLMRHRPDNSLLNESMWLYSTANNVAKASADNPAERLTTYPANDHLLGKLQLNWFNTLLYVHHSKQTTRVERPGTRVNTVENRSLDFGVQAHDTLDYGEVQLTWRAGVDARTGVTAAEHETDNTGNSVFRQTNLDAQQWEGFVAADFSYPTDTGTVAGGARLAKQYQRNQTSSHTSHDSNLSTFIGYAHPLSQHWRWSGYLSQAYRVPSLTERYFDGTTPRGSVTGSASLDTERALNVQTSLAFQGAATGITVTAFRQHIDAYIERIQIAQNALAYRNLDRATVSGVSYESWYQFDAAQLQWTLRLSGQWLTGEDSQGRPVADISPASHRLSLTMQGENSQGFVVISHRQASTAQVGGELPVASVTTLDAGYTYQVSDTDSVTVNLTNLTNRHFVVSRDEQAPFAKGRDMHVSWQRVF
ncbi:TonB-dependent receptor plug domain-containing protein [Alteromonas sp. CYL-A6]|uniref:TonB-dependent receptor plug domain-containing protein n=1 Tax=Alteromonas nitratireducens TaxID=3390813 RepID=UPI0034AF3226